jgi:uridine kinase/adenylate cyclase class IV
MAFTFHHLDKWGFANLDLSEEILEKSPRAIVLISGASSSGKSFAATYLKQVLTRNGHKALVLSLDQYNFGLSGIIPNKVNKNVFHGKLKNLEEIEARIKKIIYNVGFDSKYAQPVLDKIQAACQDLIKPEDMPKFLEGLSDEWHHLNFDEPTVYNLPEASQDIRKLYSGQSIHSKHYSKVVSERQPSRSLYDGKAYDVIIVEGIYAMDPDFLKSLKGLPLVKDFIDGNAKSLFLRRVIRDSKITSADSVFTINLYFKYIIKAYQQTILPCREEADVVLNNDMSFTELRAGSLYLTKDEVFTTSDKLVSRLIKEGSVQSVQYQKDFYFDVPGENQEANNILRFREVSQDEGQSYLPSSLIHKGAPKTRKDNKLIRPINVLLKEGALIKVWPSEEACLKDFTQSGFVIGKSEKKIKTRLVYHGQGLTLRQVEGKGTFIEFATPTKESVIKEIQRAVSQENDQD